MRSTKGTKALARKSKGGAKGLCVPPSRTRLEGCGAVRRAGSTVWRTRVALPAVPTAKWYSPGRTSAGEKDSSVEPRTAPRTSAPPTSAAAVTAVRCWRRSPGFLRPARIFSILNGRPVARDKANEERRIWPPPSPADPSMTTGSVFMLSSFSEPIRSSREKRPCGGKCV
jgi:hypothetical protein